jgi:hypothetical protein
MREPHALFLFYSPERRRQCISWRMRIFASGAIVKLRTVFSLLRKPAKRDSSNIYCELMLFLRLRE